LTLFSFFALALRRGCEQWVSGETVPNRAFWGLVEFLPEFWGQLFSDSFLSGVYDHTKGVARRINNVCHSALLLGATEGKQILDETDLKRVLLDLEGQIG